MPKTPGYAALIDQAEAVLGQLTAADLDPEDVPAALALVRSLERIDRRVRVLQVGAIDAIGSRRLHEPDGHASPQTMVGHAGHLSEPEAKRRGRAARTLAEMPAVREAVAAGRVGRCQIDRIARVFANPRVRTAFVALDAQVAMLAALLDYPEFDERLTNWVRQVDEDGTADQARRCQENRRARLVQEFDGGWELLGGFGGLTGAQMHKIHLAFVEAEFQADWAEARAIWGDKTTVDHLARTFDQRDADAMTRIFELAADAHAAAPGGAPIDLTILMDSETFEREARRAAGADVEPRPVPDLGLQPQDPDPDDVTAIDPAGDNVGDGGADGRVPDRHPGRQFRCETGDGHPIDPTEAFAETIVRRIRRMVVGWDGVVLDMSGYHTLFRGPLRDAVMLLHARCPWPGCNVKKRHCQADHLDPRRSGGRTNPDNGGPACGRHNRLKENGFTVRRDERGRLHVYRPDGTEIE